MEVIITHVVRDELVTILTVSGLVCDLKRFTVLLNFCPDSLNNDLPETDVIKYELMN